MKAGWRQKTLGEICQFSRGLTYAKSDEVESSNNVVLRATNIDLTSHQLNLTELKFIKDSFQVPSNKKVIKNSLLICTASGSKSHLGKVAYIDEDYGYAFGGFMGMITPTDELDSKFLYHLMTSDSYRNFIASLADGVNINNLKFDDLQRFPVPLPPLPEQQRIVTILDEAFEGITSAIANAEKNLSNAREIFNNYLMSVLNDPKYPVKSLGELCIRVEYGTSSKSQPIGAVPVLRMGNIQKGKLDWTNLVYSNEPTENEKYLLKINDVLFNRTNSPELVGKTAIYKGEMPAIFAGYLIRIHRNEELLDPNYLTYFLNSDKAMDYGKTVVISSVNQANINGTKLKGYPIPAPSLSEQKSIVAVLNELSSQVEDLESVYQQKLDALAELKKSILHQAFSGQLQ